MLLRSSRAQDRQVRAVRASAERERLGSDEREHLVGEASHLLALRAALKQQQIDANPLELTNVLGDLLRRADKASS
jgi:hypothetical protein